MKLGIFSLQMKIIDLHLISWNLIDWDLSQLVCELSDLHLFFRNTCKTVRAWAHVSTFLINWTNCGKTISTKAQWGLHSSHFTVSISQLIYYWNTSWQGTSHFAVHSSHFAVRISHFLIQSENCELGNVKSLVGCILIVNQLRNGNCEVWSVKCEVPTWLS